MKNSYFLVWAIVFITSCLTSAQWVEQYSGNPSILLLHNFLTTTMVTLQVLTRLS
ncbi:MAG: hypothetical protein IPH11_13230 [Ignavibacteriales bacterium]|nr:hypothetical protein [Ignavibacteriales bacterium]